MEKKSKIPYVFFIFFAVIFAVDFFYIYLAGKTWRGIVVEDSYRKGLDYNQIFAKAEKQEKLGWNLKISYKKIDKNLLLFTAILLDKNQQKIKDAKVSLSFKRPVQDGLDFSQDMQFIDGIYQAKVLMSIKGQWDVAIKAVKNDDVFLEVKRYVIE